MKLNIWKNRGRDGPESLMTLGGLLSGRSLGQPLRAGHLEMIPVFGSAVPPARYAPPETALSLTKVTTYGSMFLSNGAPLPTIVPLHLGHFQKGAQNHAMCTSWVLEAGEERCFEDACCIQAAQGGYISGAEDRFIILPQPLRSKAFALRGRNDYSKLWGDISTFNQTVGLKQRGHLDELKQVRQPEMLRVLYQFELQQGQTGAVFSVGDQVLGIELAPDAAFYAELHTPLVMYCYAPVQFSLAVTERSRPRGIELSIDGLETLEHLSARLAGVVEQRRGHAQERWERLCATPIELTTEQKSDRHLLTTVTAPDLLGQCVMHEQVPAYVSMFASA